MFKKIFWIAFLVESLLITSTFAGIKIGDVSYVDKGDDRAQLSIEYSGKLSSAPNVDLNSKYIQLVMTDATVWPKINKKVEVKDQQMAADLMAYQYDKSTVRVRAYLPYPVLDRSKTEINLVDDKILITFPREVVKEKSVAQYDEKYLDNLLGLKEQSKKEQNKKVDKVPETKAFEKILKEEKKKDVVKTTMASNKKVEKGDGGFSFAGYIGKFVAFLGLVLLLFYGIVNLMRKGVLSKGKLGFLNKTQVVTVLNTTYIGPKRSLIMVKVHDQVLLLGSSESGITMLSEIDNVTGLLKEGEKQVAGDNFDTTYGSLENDVEIEKKVKLKDENRLNESVAESKDKVKFSDKIKEKVKTLKPLH